VKRWAAFWAILSVVALVSAPSIGATPPCEACHGEHGEGQAAAHIPRIAGQSADYLKKQLDDFASGARVSPVMANFAKVLSEEKRAQLAAHFAGMATAYLPAPGTAPNPVSVSRGHQLAYQGDQLRRVQACNSCHGPAGSGVPHSAPYLAGQSSEYLAGALRAFQSGSRKNDSGELMRSVASRLSENDIEAVSAYFAQAGATSAYTASK
jgi:cytochrome c553